MLMKTGYMADHSTQFPQTAEQLRTFMALHLSKLTHHAWYILGDRDDAGDVVQETIIKAYRMREALGKVQNPVAYLFRMVSNAAYDMRRRNNTRETATAGMQRLFGDQFAKPVEDHLIREEEFVWIRSLLELLPHEQAEVIRFRVADELSFAEIAEVVEAPVATVKSRFSYGMIKLRSMVNKQKEVTSEM